MPQFCAVLNRPNNILGERSFYKTPIESDKPRDEPEEWSLPGPSHLRPHELQPDRGLSEETRKLHIAPLLDHNYASKPPHLKMAAPVVIPSTSTSPPNITYHNLRSSGSSPEQPSTSFAVKEEIKTEEESQPASPVEEIKKAADAETIRGSESEMEIAEAKTESPKQPVEAGDRSPPGDKPGEPDVKQEEKDPWQDEDYVTRCICGYDHDDGYMISCDKCMVWQHVDCMELERNNIPDEYLCELCGPREVDREYAQSLQASKREILMRRSLLSPNPPSDLSNSDGENVIAKGRKKVAGKKDVSATKRKKQAKPVPPVVKKKTKREQTKVGKREREPPPPEAEIIASEDSDLRDWIDSYEEAITNHYSPELRARVSALKTAEVHCPQRLLGAHSQRSRVKAMYLPAAGRKVLVATCNIPTSQVVVEIRGKYMLAKAGDSPPPRSKEQYIFTHKLIGPGQLSTTVQVDTSTYGNCARFIRSSCSPNSQILHCIEKGTLHLYVVSTKAIDGDEVLLPHRPGASCLYGSECSLLTRKQRRSRKQILVERVGSRELQNNNYKELPQRKRSSSSERPLPAKSTKSGGGVRQEQGKVTKPSHAVKTGKALRSTITGQLRRAEAKIGHTSLKKP